MMGGGSGGGNRVEADRWLATAEKLLAAGDLRGAKTFAIRACEANSGLSDAADSILTVTDTLLAGESRVGSTNLPDWYAVLRLSRLTHNPEFVAMQYGRLALLLNPSRNHLPFADRAFRLVSDAWYVLSEPSRKALYDRELKMSQVGQLGQLGLQLHSQPQPTQQPKESPQEAFQPPEPRVLLPHQQQQTSHGPQFFLQPQSQTPPRVEQTSEVVDRQRTRHESRESVPTRQPAEERLNLNNATEPCQQFSFSEPAQRIPISESSEQINLSGKPQQPSGENECSQKHENDFTTPRPVEKSPWDEAERDNVSDASGFWTACPFCFVLYEYPIAYKDCTLRCQDCRRGFQAVTIPSPPVAGKEAYFCCWGIFPLGFSTDGKFTGGISQSRMHSRPKKPAAPKVYYDDDVYIELSDPSEEDSDDDDWQAYERKKKLKKTQNAKDRRLTTDAKRKPGRPRKFVQSPSSQDRTAVRKRGRPKKIIQNVFSCGTGSTGQEDTIGSSPSRVLKHAGNFVRKRTGNDLKDLGKLDLNVEFSNEVEDPGPTHSRNECNGSGNGGEDIIEGGGFFEGLDEFFSTLPILSGVTDDKVKAN